MKVFVSIIVSLLLATGARADSTQVLVTKSGTTYMGHVAAQLSKGRIEFASENSVVTVEGQCTVSDSYKTTLKKLPKQVQEWINAQGGDNINQTIQMSKVSANGILTDSVYVLEKGAKTRFIVMNPGVHTIAWKDIASISSKIRPANQKYGVNVRYHLKDGSIVEGQYAGETETTLSLYTKNGVLQTCNLYDVLKYEYYAVGDEADLLMVSEDLDLIKTKNAKNVKGVIKEKNYQAANPSDYYFVVKTKDGEQKIMLSDILEIRKTANVKQKKQTTMLEGQIKINEALAKNTSVIKKSGEPLYVQVVDKIDVSGMKVLVEYLSNDKQEMYPIVKLTQKKKNLYYFTYENLFSDKLHYIAEDSEFVDTFKAKYILTGAGLYAIYNKDNNSCVIISSN